jgi:hypothetical protein
MSPSRRKCALVALICLVWSPGAHAIEPYRLEYEAPAECPGRDVVVASMLRHSRRAEVTQDPRASALSIVVEMDGPVYRVTVRANRLGGAAARRDVPAATCEEAVEAAALVAAILVDPEAADRPSEAAETVEAEANAQKSGTLAEQPSLEKPERDPLADNATPSDVRRAARASDGTAWRFGAAFQGGVTFSLAKFASPILGVALDAEPQSYALFSPRLRLSGHWARGALIETSDGSGRLSTFAGRATVCPMRARLGGEGWLGPCAFFEAGQLSAHGEETSPNRSVSIFWAAFGTIGRGELTIGRAYGAVEAGVVLPLLRDRFYLDPRDTTVRTVPAIAALGTLDVGVRFP